MADEAISIMTKEKFVICIHQAGKDLNASKSFIGVHESSVITVETLTLNSKDVVSGIDPERFREQYYDGCNTIMDKNSRVAARIIQELNKNVLNLAWRHIIKNFKLIKNALESSSDISELARKSHAHE